MITLTARGVRLVLNPHGGHLEEAVFDFMGRTFTPLHQAHWRTGENNNGRPEALAADTPVVLQSLAGDFFCAPFCDNDIEGGPSHGWPANGDWTLADHTEMPDGARATFALAGKVMGAQVLKEITLYHDHPFIYQRHLFVGGAGALPVSYHAMIRAGAGLRLSFSPKRFGATPGTPLEPDPAKGRSVLAYPQRFETLASVQRADGQRVDASRYPFAEAHEDLIVLAETPGNPLGWSAALAASQGFALITVKDPAVLPFTTLWMSNGGRDYPPWSGRHRGVLGIEEGCTHFHYGHRASIKPNALNDEGYPTAIVLEPKVRTAVDYALGIVPADERWAGIATVAASDHTLVVTDRSGAQAQVPFASAWLRPAG